jgi:hypothetical protein
MSGRRATRLLLLAAVGAVALIAVAVAAGFNSGGRPSALGPDTITWTGNGASGGSVQQECTAADDPFGANAPYLYWVLNPGGNSTIAPNPVLTLSGSGSGSAIGAPTSTNSSTSSAYKFVTGYFTPDSHLIANVAMNVLSIAKKSSWILTISHGCGGGTTTNPPASDLNVFKTASPAADITYKWNIQKSVDGATSQNIASGGSATFNYNVSVGHDNGTLSNWTVSGDIEVTNPNVDTVHNVSVTDAIQSEPNASCTIANGDPGSISPTNGSIPGGAAIDYAYTCTYSAAPAAGIQTNEADVTYPSQNLPDDGALTGNTLPGIAAFNWNDAQLNPTNESVSVDDSLYGSLGTVDAITDPNPSTFSYSLPFDGVAGTCTDYPNTASLSGGATGSSSQTVTVCDGSDLGVSKTATPSFTRTYTWGIKKSVDSSQVNIPSGGTATSNYTVAVSHDGGTDSAWKVDGQITVSNPNDWESVALTGVVDQIDNGGTCSITSGDANATLAPAGQDGDSVTLGYECTYASAPDPAAFTNTATASWDANAASTPDGTATGTKDGAFGDPTTIVDGSVDVTDSSQGDLGSVSYSDASPKLLTYSIDRSGVASTCTEYDNTASFLTSDTQSTGSDSASVTVCDGSDLGVSKTAHPSYTRTYTWGIDKSVDHSQVNQPSGSTATSNYTVAVSHDGGTDSAWKVDGKITVSNPNDWESITADVSDLIDNGGSCSVTGGSGVEIPAGGSVTLDYSCSYDSAPSPAAFTNTATATWDASAASTPDGSATGTKDGAFGDPTTIVDGSVDVTDSSQGDLGSVSYTDASPKLFTYSIDRTGVAGSCKSYDNTASFLTSDTQSTGSDSASVTVCDGSDLGVSKTATPSYTRTYAWGINKSVDKTKVDQSSGSVVFNYTVAVTHDSGTDSGWTVAGTITVSNPNDWEGVTLTGVTDQIDNGGTCSITSGNPTGVVPASSSVQLGYTCTYASAPSPSSYTNTASASWNAGSASTPDGSASGQAGGAFGAPTTITNSTIHVTDSIKGALGTVSYTDSSPKSFTYSNTVAVVSNQCVTVPNTATITETGQNSSKSVQVCGLVTGGLTMGYWQNKNGQALITGASPSKTALCPLTTYLRGAAFGTVFSDLGATATCPQVAVYVTNVINNATAAGPTMNAMLKGQMLATALAVRLAGLNGNENVDLTNIWNKGENTSSAFGGNNCLSVNALLAYASSQLSGTTWYGGNKVTQGLAKDTFDAINNGVVFTC